MKRTPQELRDWLIHNGMSCKQAALQMHVKHDALFDILYGGKHISQHYARRIAKLTSTHWEEWFVEEGIKRNCLKCDRAFTAENRFIRTCDKCKNTTDYQYWTGLDKVGRI